MSATSLLGRRARPDQANADGEIVWIGAVGEGSSSTWVYVVLLFDNGSMGTYQVSHVTVAAESGVPYR